MAISSWASRGCQTVCLAGKRQQVWHFKQNPGGINDLILNTILLIGRRKSAVLDYADFRHKTWRIRLWLKKSDYTD